MTKILSIVQNTLNNDARVLRMGRSLDNAGFDVSFCALGDINYNNKVVFKNSLYNIEVNRMSWRLGSDLSQDILNNKNRNYSLWQLIRDIKKDIQKAHRLFKIIKTIDTDIYYCNDFNTLTAGYFSSRRRRARLVYDSHELWVERTSNTMSIFMKFKRSLEYFIEWLLIKRCDLVITVSDGIADELVGRYNIKRPLVIRNLDTIKELPSEEEIKETRCSLNIPEDCTLIVYQGRLSNARGISELTEAFFLLPDNYHLLLMGKGLNKHMNVKIESNDRIHFPGMISQEHLFNYTASCDIGIAPIKKTSSISYALAFPNKFSQYMNAGLALLLYNIDSSREIISKCNCGEVLNSINPEEIARKIESINVKDIDSMKINSRQCFLKYYNWNIDKIKLIKELYRLR